jgi:hypothetical protein
MLLSLSPSSYGQQTQRQQRESLRAPSVKARGERRDVSERALARLRVLRDGWNDVNRQYISPNFTAGKKIDPRAYEVQYLEAKTEVDGALRILPVGELRAAIGRAMDLFDDLEGITSIFTKKSPFNTSVRVADVYPYLKKYDVPYEAGVARAGGGLVLHQDFVMSYILPLRHARVNQIEVLLGGTAAPPHSPPTFERMFGAPAQKKAEAETVADAEELKAVIHRVLTARVRGDRTQMAMLLDDDFVGTGRGGRRWHKGQYLRAMSADPTVKGFTIKLAELRSRNGAPTLSTAVSYESLSGEVKSYENTFTFVKRGGRWLIAAWQSF